MRRFLLFAVITILLPALSASADSLSYEAGIGFSYSSSTTVNLLRYRHELDPLFGLSSYLEASFSSWNGPNHAYAIAIARGIRWGRAAEYLSFTIGLSHISRTTENLGQPFEFYERLAFEKSVGKALFSIGWIHYSDGQFVFGQPGPNNGENFAAISIGFLF